MEWIWYIEIFFIVPIRIGGGAYFKNASFLQIYNSYMQIWLLSRMGKTGGKVLHIKHSVAHIIKNQAAGVVN